MSDSLDRLVDRYIRMVVDDSPTYATYLGLHENDGALGEFSLDALRGRRDKRARMLSEVENLPPAGAEPAESVDAHVLRTALRRSIFEHDVLRTHERDPSYYIRTAVSGCNQLLLRDFAPLEERAASFLGRLRAIPAVVASCEENVHNPPAVFASTAADVARRGGAFLRESVSRLAPEVPALRADLEKAAATAEASLGRAADRLDAMVSPERPSFHVGRDAYEWLLKEFHLLDLDSDALLEVGRNELEATRAEILAVAERLDPSRTWREVIDGLAVEHPSRDGLKAYYASQMERARDFVVSQGIATIPDGEVLDVVDMPEYLRSLLPYAAYGPPGPFEKEQRGFFYVTPIPDDASPDDAERQLRGHAKNKIAIVALHEGYPGHHLQLVRANLIPGRARKLASSNIFIEGWALYCEQMMRETGFWGDDKMLLGQLKAALWRAARVAVDVGLQRGEMSIDEAVEFMVDEAGLVRVQAEAEVRRYTANPTQPSSYLIGKLAILRIRTLFERARGDAFSLREFHDRLLDVGSIPPRLAETVLGVGGPGE